MKFRSVLFLVAGFVSACAPDSGFPIPQDAAPPEPEFCASPPYAQLSGEGFDTSADPTCATDPAYLESALDPVAGLQLRCAQFVTGEVFCMDATAPVDTVYQLSNGVCHKIDNSAAPWFIWRSCGFKPVPFIAGMGAS